MRGRMDALAIELQTSLQQKSAFERAQDVIKAFESLEEQIRTLEMMKSDYVVQQKRHILLSSQSPELAERLRHAGAASKCSAIIRDLEPRLRELKSIQSKISAALGS